MDRGGSSPFITELQQGTNAPCFLFELYFDSGVDYLTDAIRPVSWNAHTYMASGRVLSFSGIVESSDLQIPTVTLIFSGVDQAYVSLALNEPFLDRRIVIYKCLLDSALSAISSPIAIFDGRMDTMTVNDEPGGSTTISISATNQFGDFEKKPGRHSNSKDQQVYFSGDKFFDYVSQINRQMKWGSA